MRIILTIIFLMANSFLMAQQRVNVTGAIIDQDTGEPLEFASISILNPIDSSLVTGNVTNAQGKFEVSVEPGQYLLKSQFISYNSKFQKINVQDNLNVGTISLSQDVETIGEVVVTGQKDQMQLELDKRVFNVSENINNIGISASQILDNLPSIAVDVDGNVALRGSQNVRILINGRPSGLAGLSSTDALRQLQGNLIERIEVVTNPSARYDAEGSAGIINIILKKKRDEGFNGAVTLNTGYPHDHGISANINYRRDWFNTFLNYGFNYDENPGGGYSNQSFFKADTAYQTNLTRDRVRGGISNTVRFGTEFFLNENNTLTASFTTRISDEENTSTILYRDFINDGQLIDFTRRVDVETEDDDNYEFDLNYRRTYEGEGHELSAAFQYRINNETEASDIEEVNLMNGGDIEEQQRSLNEEGNTNMMLQADYVRPLGEFGKLEVGYRGTFQQIGSDYEVDSVNSAGEWVNVPAFTNEFYYDELVNAAYVIGQYQVEKFGLQLGLRTEHTNIDIRQPETNVSNNKNYINFFPSAFVSYKVTETNQLQASYSRRLSRPRFWYLNPFLSISDARNLRTGNIDLDPEFTDSYEAGYLRNADNYSLYFGGFYRYTTQLIDRVTYPIERGDQIIMFSQPYNIGIENAYGLEMNFSSDPADWLNINGNANFYRAVTDGVFTYNNSEGEQEDVLLDRDTYTANFRLNARMNFGKYNFQLSGRYNAPEEDTQGTRKAIYTMDIGANRDIIGNKGTITLSVRDLFNSRKYRGTQEGENFYQETEFQWRSRQINLSFTYRINQKKTRSERRGDGDGYEGGGDDMEF